jgi:hypothetical protein
MVSKVEVARFQHVAEMIHCLVDSQQLSIANAVFLLGRVKLLGENGEGLRGVVDTLLQRGIIILAWTKI